MVRVVDQVAGLLVGDAQQGQVQVEPAPGGQLGEMARSARTGTIAGVAG